ncbi:MAG: lytic transglycosylase domain-containing protein [Acidobacteria bacterium]|nr:lytic transglycosylase domain-containing protein [Acidobacteriota bacterium]
MRPNLVLLAVLSLITTFSISAVGPDNNDDVSANAPAGGLAVKSRHYIPSPATGKAYQDTAAAEGEIDRRLPKMQVASTARVEMREYAMPVVYTAPAVAVGEARMAANRSLRGYSTGSDLIDSFIVDSAHRYGIDPLLIFSQMNQESSFKPRALSPKGASGLMQLMPFTARRMGVTNIYDPQQNIEGGVKYMRLLLNMFDDDLVLALAGYNAGEGAVIKYGNQVPPYKETIDYVRRIVARYRNVTATQIALGHDFDRKR